MQDPFDTNESRKRHFPKNPLIQHATSASRGKPHDATVARKSSNPLFDRARAKAPEPPPPPTGMPPEPSALESLGNILDLPGSSVRDALAAKNPFDQWLTPTRSENRTTGRELLRQHGLVGNKDGWGNAIAGFGAEVLLDPTTYMGVGIFTKGGKALSKAGLLRGSFDNLTDSTTKTVRNVLEEAEDVEKARESFRLAGGTDAMLDQPLKRVVDFAGNDVAKPFAPAIDKAIDAISSTAPMRHLRAAFDTRVMNVVSKPAQEIAEHRKAALDETIAELGYRFAPAVKNSDMAVAKSLLGSVVKDAEYSGLEMSRFTSHVDAKDVSQALQNSEHLTKAAAMAHATNELLGVSARTDGAGVPMLEALKRLGIDTDASRAAVSDWAGGRPIESLRIDEALLNDAGRFIRPYTDPEAIGGVRKAIEQFNRLWKAHITLPFPAFHTRNLAGGQIQNLILGANRLNQLPTDIAMSYRLRQGKVPNNLSNQIPEYKHLGLSDAEATTKLREELFAHNVSGDWQSAIDVSKRTPDAASRMPGANPLHDAARPTLKQSINPMDIDRFFATRIGGNVASFVEDINRITGYIGLRKQGYAPAEAAQRIKTLQADYSEATRWERKYGRNVIPFYMFSKKMLALTAQELAQHPGGPLSQTIKASTKSDSDPTKPKWMKGETSLRLGGKHFAGFGLMHQDAANQLGSLLSGNAQKSAQDLVSRSNPFLKFLLEQSANKDVYSGRPLHTFKTAEQITGIPVGPTAEHLLRNLPATRYIQEARKLQAKRENAILNLATGLKSSS